MNSTTSYFLKGTFLFILFLLAQTGLSQSTEPDKKTNSTTYAQNPVIWADVPDPSIIRVGDSYYMSSTTMHFNPGVPIMKSDDLVNWEIINYVYDTLESGRASCRAREYA